MGSHSSTSCAGASAAASTRRCACCSDPRSRRGCARSPTTATASSSPRSTSSCGARARCWVRASRGSPSSASPGCPRTPSCSSVRACAPAPCSTPTPRCAGRSTSCSTTRSTPPTARRRSSQYPRNHGSDTLARMSHSTLRRAAALLAAGCVAAVLPTTASAKPQDLKVMIRNVYLGADLIPLASAPNRDAFEHAVAERFQTVARNDFPTRAKALANELAKAKPDIVGVQEATVWRRGSDGVKDGSATPAQQIIYDSAEELLKALRAAGAPYHEAVGRDWFDFEAPSSLGYDIRITQRDVVLVRNKSKVKVSKTLRGGFKTFLSVPTQAGSAQERRGWV